MFMLEEARTSNMPTQTKGLVPFYEMHSIVYLYRTSKEKNCEHMNIMKSVYFVVCMACRMLLKCKKQ